MRALVCLVLLAVTAVFPAGAHAQWRSTSAKSTNNTKTAKQYVDAGLAAQNSGDYDTAIQLYEKAYALVPHPVLLFDMAQANRLAGRIPQALALYARYLAADPNGPQAKTARVLVAVIEAAKAEAAKAEAARQAELARQAEQARLADEARKAEATRQDEQARQDREREARAAAPAPEAVGPSGPGASEPIAQAPGRSVRLAGIAVGAAGAVSLVVGVGFAIHGRSLSSEVEKHYDPAKVDAGNRANTVAAIGLVGGTVLVAGGAALYWWGYRQGRGAERLTIAPLVTDRLAGLVVSGSL